MKIFESGKIKIIEFDKFSDYLKDDFKAKEYDVVLIKELHEGLIKYPTHIGYKLNLKVKDIEEYLSRLNQKNRYTIKKYYKKVTQKYTVQIFDNIPQEEFQKWKEGYDKFIDNKLYGINRFNNDWFEKHKSDSVGVFFYLENKLEGGLIGAKNDRKIAMAYAWYSDELRQDGGAYASIYNLIAKAINENIPKLSFGRDTNLYGGHLTIGLHNFKKAFEPEPRIPKKAELFGAIIHTDKPLIYYAIDQDNKLVKQEINF